MCIHVNWHSQKSEETSTEGLPRLGWSWVHLWGIVMFINWCRKAQPLWVTPFLELVVLWLCKKPTEQEPGIRPASTGLLWLLCQISPVVSALNSLNNRLDWKYKPDKSLPPTTRLLFGQRVLSQQQNRAGAPSDLVTFSSLWTRPTLGWQLTHTRTHTAPHSQVIGPAAMTVKLWKEALDWRFQPYTRT